MNKKLASSIRSSTLDWMMPALWVFGFFGFQLYLITLVGSGNWNQNFSIAYRSGFLLLALSVVFVSSRAHRVKVNLPAFFVMALITFISLYTLRIVYDSVLTDRVNAFEYFSKCLGGAFIPMMAYFVPINGLQSKRGYLVLFFTVLATVLVAGYLYQDLLGGGYRGARYQSGVDEDTLITPHKLSYNGAALCALALWGVLWKRGKFGSFIKLMFAVALVLGAGMLTFGGSKGAVFSLVACVLAILFTGGKISFKSMAIIIGAISFIGAGSILIETQANSEGTMFMRIEHLISALASNDSEAGAGRLYLWKPAIQQFLENPLTGSAIVEKTSGFYPHNHILESFMAIGLFGGASFIVINSFGIHAAFKLLRYQSHMGWIAILYIFYFIFGLVSSPIYSAELWLSLAAVMAAHYRTRSVQ